MGFLTHIMPMVVRGPGRWGGSGGLRRDDSFTRTLQASRKIPQHRGVSHWRELVMAWAHKQTGTKHLDRSQRFSFRLDNSSDFSLLK